MLAAGIAVLCVSGAIAGTAQAPQDSRSFGPGRCGPVDPALSGLASATGGQMFLMSPSDMAAAKPAVDAMVTAGDRTATLLLSAAGTTGDAAEPISFVVDPTVRRLIITAMFDGTGGTLQVLAPDATTVEANEQIQDTRMACGRTLLIERPDAGVWQAAPLPSGPSGPSGRFWLRANGVSDFALTTAEFVESGGALSHGGSFKIAGQPVAGRAGTLAVSMSGPVMQSYDFALISEQGRVLEPLTLKQVSDLSWEGAIIVPREPFRVGVSGMDQSEGRFQRWSKAAFQPELVEVRAPGPTAEVQAGTESRLAFTIRNAGLERASFGIAASDDRRLVTRVDPVLVDLAAGAEQQVTVWLKVPAGAVAERADQLTVTATGIDSAAGSRSTSNTAVIRIAFRE